jgi:glucose-1-phosphate adenylyltransferase
VPEPPLNLNDRRWVIHTRTEERPPAWIEKGSQVVNSMLSDGCVIEKGALVENSVLSPGVVVYNGAVIRESIVMTDCRIGPGASIERSILDKRVQVGENASIGGLPTAGSKEDSGSPVLTLVGKNSKLPPQIKVQPGAIIGTDVVYSDFDNLNVEADAFIQTKRQPFEVSD